VTFSIINQQKKAMQRGDSEEYQSGWVFKQQRAEQTASSADARLLHGDIEDALVKFRQLRQKQTTRSAPLMSTDGMLLSDKDSVMARRQDHFIILLNQPLYPPLSTLLSETAAPALILSLKHSQVIE